MDDTARNNDLEYTDAERAANTKNQRIKAQKARGEEPE